MPTYTRRYVNLGWGTTDTATSPSVTPAALQTLEIISLALVPGRQRDPIVFRDGTPFERAQSLIYTFTLDIFVTPFDFTTAGVANMRQLEMWWQNQPKFMQSTSADWNDKFGSGWVKVAGKGMNDMGVDQQYGYKHYKIGIRVPPIVLT